MNELSFLAEVEQWAREKAIYPKAERKARFMRELELLQGRESRTGRRRRLAQGIGHVLVGTGDRLVSLGERLAPSVARTPASPPS